jgi:ABC-type Fe3+/spermidine/putrescine transport system ATPase subunit
MIPVIDLREVSLVFSGKTVLSGVTLSVNQGEILALLGPSGSGKSSVLRLILGFEAPTRGVVKLHEQVVSRNGAILTLPEDRHLAVVFQDLALWPHLTVWGNLEFGLKARHVPSSERELCITRILQRLSLADMGDRYPRSLSGGERQRVAIARALVLQPQAVLMDEPMANLDVVLRGHLLKVFREVLKESQLTALYITHDLREAEHLADRVAILEQGRLVQTGDLNDLRQRPASEFIRGLFEELRPSHLPAANREAMP